MKRAWIFVVCILSVAALGGCTLLVGTHDIVSTTEVVIEKEDIEPVPEEWQIILTTESVTADGLTLKAEITDPAASPFTGAAFWLDEYTEDGWQEARRITGEDIAWDAIAYTFTEGYAQWEIGWEHIYGTLDSGKYRIGKKFTAENGESKYFYAQFEII